MNSRDKGARGEREWAKFLRSCGFDARRGQQYSGGHDSPDVVVPDLAGVHFEVKRTERFRLQSAVAQAAADAGDQVPVVVTRQNRGEWLCVLRAVDLLEMFKEVQS